MDIGVQKASPSCFWIVCCPSCLQMQRLSAVSQPLLGHLDAMLLVPLGSGLGGDVATVLGSGAPLLLGGLVHCDIVVLSEGHIAGCNTKRGAAKGNSDNRDGLRNGPDRVKESTSKHCVFFGSWLGLFVVEGLDRKSVV